MLTPILPVPSSHQSANHQYETRIRSNSAIKPSVRLRQPTDVPPPPPRRLKPLPGSKAKPPASRQSSAATEPTLPPFPPPHVTLHPDDANSKVFLAIGRSLMAVAHMSFSFKDNRAVTVKDLGELCMQHGLICQNLSAAGQAITTFMRNHSQRCETQLDQPLLLRHIMSGTPSDDELVAGLYSRVGGAHCTQAEDQNRLTNFRRGTAVWYLSKAAGAPCPFARAGIRLCDYNENGKVGMPINAGREKKRERDRLRKAGQKRKRLLRSCADKVPESVTDSSDEEDRRPPKVKLMLKLKPSLTPTPSASLSDIASSDSHVGSMPDPQPSPAEYDAQSDQSDSDSMSVDSDGEDSVISSFSATSSSQPSTAIPVAYHTLLPSFRSSFSPDFPSHSDAGGRRSPSVPYSTLSGSPPPDSEEEDEDFHITMTGARHLSVGRFHTPSEDDDSGWEDDFFGDLDADAETQWESPGPRSPSVQLDEEVVVKEEPTDVRGLLDAWEHLDNAAADLKVIDVVAQAAAAERRAEESPSDDFAAWSWPSIYPEEFVRVKQEDDDVPLFFSENVPTPPPGSLSPIVPFDPSESPVEERALNFRTVDPAYELHWRDVEILGPDSLKPHDLDDGAWHEYRVTRATSPEERNLSPSPEPSTAAASSSPSPTLSRSTLAPLDVQSAGASMRSEQGRLPSISSPSLLSSLTSLCLQTPAVSVPSALSHATAPQPVEEPLSQETAGDKGHAIPTTIPCVPAILAIRLEGVAVYQSTWGSSTLLRRVDTDFVNASPISQVLSVAIPTAPSAVVITAGSPLICGTWVPLSVAQNIAGDDVTLATFLSDDLRSLFPDALHTLQPALGLQAVHPQFGHQFESASQARRRSMTSHRLELPPREFEVSWEDHLSTHPPFILATAALDEHRPAMEEIPAVVETPLSPTEEEMFHVLCATSEWETDECMDQTTEALSASTLLPDITDCVQERPLRRSKRVANAAATRSRTRSSRRGSRTSLS
ncbi:transcription factor [Ganoderma sinense ZZ0214-1]|uniref:Transcription factor n=1 Tax=Ganoderma sinense ZZ0214-1 TaxID=1077348 RepID=A0A2G8RQP8_9APHY|nr:transcription factor [Ganoderma sinense ZZ0214-1]